MFFIGFIKGLFHRESCYQCIYATSNRVADLTLGDFWGLGKEIPFCHEMKNGVSVVLVNTAKGEVEFDSCKKDLFYEQRTLQEAIIGNHNLKSPAHKHANYNKFIIMYKRHGFKVAAKSCLKKDIIKCKLLKILQKSNLAMKIISKIK